MASRPAIPAAAEPWAAAARAALPEKKFAHCAAVAELMMEIAPAIGAPPERAAAAGYLHDLCRTLSKRVLLARAEAFGLPIPEAWRAQPVLLHGPVAAETVRRDFGLQDPEIYEAIYWHTLGRPGMGLLAQALYLADFAEPNRKNPEAAQTRAVFRSQGFLAALRHAAEAKRALSEAKGGGGEGRGFVTWALERDR